MQVDFRARELTLKLVYYGPALSGKTTNLRALHEAISEGERSRLMTLETRDDRTLFFDLLPMAFRVGEVSLRLKMFTVPGQVMHNATRRLVLQGADGVAFIADSQLSEARANAESFVNLKQNLRELGISVPSMPLVIQFNKRDLPNVRSDGELEQMARLGKEPVFRGVAVRGEGVVETFVGLLRRSLERLQNENDLRGRFQLDPEFAVTAVCAQLGIRSEIPREATFGVQHP